MNNNIIFNSENNNSDSDNLIKENTPETVDYDKLYNINKTEETNNTNIINNNVTNNLNNYNTNNDVIKSNAEITKTISEKENKKFNGLLFVIAIFIVLMGLIIFVFPLIAKYLL